MLKRLISWTGVDIYGETLMDTVVRRYLAFYVAVIGVNFFWDWFLWNLVFVRMMGGYWPPLGLSFALAFFILTVEWNILIQDTTVSIRRFAIAIGVRVGFMAFLAVPTGTIYDLESFKTEIAVEFDRKEKEGADAERELIIADIRADYATRLKEKKTALADRPEQAEATIAANRATMIAGQQAKVDRLMAQKAAKSKEVATAARQLSGRRNYGGNKDAYVALQKQESDLRDDLAKLDEANVAAQAQFDANAATQTIGTVDSVQGATDAVLAKQDAEIAAIRALSQKELGDAYPGNWVVSRGVMDEYRMLGIVISQSLTNKVVALVLWGIGMTPPTFLLIMKLLAPVAVIRYFSLAAQARAGNADAKKRLAEMGYGGDLTFVGQTKEALKPRQDVDALRIEVRDEIVAFKEWLATECAPDSATGTSKPEDAMIRLASAHWDSGIGKNLRKLSDLEAAARGRGVLIPPWPDDWDVKDPRKDPDVRLWLVGEDELAAQHGWVKPPAATTAPRVVLRSVP